MAVACIFFHVCWGAAAAILHPPNSLGDGAIIGGTARPDVDLYSTVAVRDDIRNKVVVAGGNPFGVLAVSLSWGSPDDLDLHLLVPSGETISYRNRRVDGGELDVDMCVHGLRGKLCNDGPVENIVFETSPAPGRYRALVRNFNFHESHRPLEAQIAAMRRGSRIDEDEQKLRSGKDRPIPFDVLLKVGSTHKLFTGLCTPAGKTHEASEVLVFEFDYHPDVRRGAEDFTFGFEHKGSDYCGRRRPRLEKLAKGSFSAVPQRRPMKNAHPTGKRKLTNENGVSLGDSQRFNALGVLRANSRESLSSKPLKILRQMLTEVGATCRGCFDKQEFVNRLLEVREEL